MQEIALRNSRKKNTLFLLVCAGFVAMGVFLLAAGDPSDAWIGWLSVAFFGTGAVVFVRQLLDARPRLVVNDAGVEDRTLGGGLISWGEIEEAYLLSIHSNPFICLELRDPARFLARLSPFKRRLARINRRLGFTECSLNLSGVAVDPQQLLELILHRIELEKRRAS